MGLGRFLFCTIGAGVLTAIDKGSQMYRNTSVPLDGGGDTHLHPWDSDTGVTVTHRTSDYEEHLSIRDRDIYGGGGDEDLTGFRALFGDDNK